MLETNASKSSSTCMLSEVFGNCNRCHNFTTGEFIRISSVWKCCQKHFCGVLLDILGHFLPPNFGKYCSDNLKFSEKLLLNELLKVCKNCNHLIKFAVVAFKVQFLVKIEKNLNFSLFCSGFFLLTSENIVQIIWHFYRTYILLSWR